MAGVFFRYLISFFEKKGLFQIIWVIERKVLSWIFQNIHKLLIGVK